MPKCKARYSPVHRSYSMNKRIPIDKEEGSFHLVSLTSSTLGSLRLDPLNQIIKDDQLLLKRGDNDEGKYNKAEFEMGLIEANTWSQMINEKIPKVIPKLLTVIFYFTSLRGLRKTYKDCCHVRGILKGLGVEIDERDVSMHAGFKEELKELLLGEEYIGGVDEICRMHEDGQLEKIVESCERVEDGFCEGLWRY
ncbi:hypothetical protein K7X08_033630 [Anisodus acutangulus]|uniref:Glutaredoxin domain-containing protein n=1 Tax=Anisodus acutangulus TaxID=402998 RepID=A0A9Q1M5C0_9SOLA|nr:hypothetical protein K7X08_033630 [Anisodus acutangulus]